MSHTGLPADSNGVQLTLNELLNYKSHTIHWRPPAKSLWSQLNGSHISRQQGRGMNFSEVRQYQVGDDIRSIDWRVTARTGKTHTKIFSEEREQPVVLYLDISPSMRFGSQLLLKSVQGAHLASLLSWLTVEQKDRIGALIDTGEQLIEIKPTARSRGALHICHQLVTAHNLLLNRKNTTQGHHQTVHSTPLFSHTLQTLHRLCPKGSDIIFISDFQRLSMEVKPVLTQLNQHNRLQFVHIYDPLEMGQTHYRGSEQVSDGKQSRWLNFGLKSTRQQLLSHHQQHLQQLQQLCRQLAIPLRSLSSGNTLLTQLTKTINGGQA